MSFGVEGGATHISNGPHGAVGLFLLKRSAKAINAGVAVYPKRASAVLHGVSIVENQDRWCGELREHIAHDGCHARREEKNYRLLENGRDWSNPFGHI